MNNNNMSWFKLPSFFQKQSKSAACTMQTPAPAPQDMSNEKVISTTVVSWMPKIPSKKSNTSLLNTEAASANHTTNTASAPLTPLESTTADLAEQQTNSIETYIVPLRQFLRYSMNRSDQRNFQRRRLMQPSSPKYEIEWQKNQWLLLDDSTNKQIEHLCKNGFTKIAIRKDTCLKKHISYSNPSDMDVLLELSFDTMCDKSSTTTSPQDDVQERYEPIVCHQPRKFSVRRTQWWKTTYHVAEAYLPDWVDPDLCCEAVMMDAPSVLAAMTDNYSRSSLSSSVHHQPKMPDTPIVSQKSSFLHLQQHQLQLEDQWSYKPLQYSDPPFLMDKPALVMG
ncbi:hypothetical protein MBANPS3_002661 [Mucor bainieri]